MPSKKVRVKWTEEHTVTFDRGDVPLGLLEALKGGLSDFTVVKAYHWQDFEKVTTTVKEVKLEEVSVWDS